MTGYINTIETLGGLDGPGIRTVFFLQGCPARCLYCHNPEMLEPCSQNQYTSQQVVDIAKRHIPYYGKFGGVTFGGGEPLVQSEFLLDVIPLLKKNGIDVVVDTSGIIYSPEVLKIADLIILDIKHTDRVGFEELVGVPIDNTLRTLEFLNDNNLPFWVRQVIIDGINSDEDNIIKLKRLAHKAQKIELLPYHSMARHKYEKLGKPYPNNLKEPSRELMDKLIATLK
ncbi:MAG: radical SAM protein [Firmicutes bacterium]|nr:radical SAM protein [Bacillota bacterium]